MPCAKNGKYEYCYKISDSKNKETWAEKLDSAMR